MATKEFEHQGEVISVGDGYITVGFMAQSACSSCQARSKCGMGEAEQRVVDVEIDDNSLYKIGDKVTIAVKSSMGVMAVMIAYVVPFFWLMISLFSLVGIGVSEGVAALSSLALLAVYYCLVYLMRAKIEKNIKFTIAN